MAITAKWTDFSHLDSEQLIAAINEKLPRWITLLLVLVIAWQLARIVWMIIPGPASEVPIVAPPAQATNRAAAGQANVGTIASSHLFGVADPVDVVAETPKSQVNDVDALPDARVAFSVTGIMAANDPSYSVAIIADQSKEESVYMIGAMIQQGTTLEEIHEHLIVVRQNGALYKLELPKDFPQSTPSVRRSAPAVSQASANMNTQSIQNVVAQNVTKLADVIRPTPYFANGQQQGYRVYPGRDRKQFAKLGLRPGDLIKDIDGAALTDPTQALQIFENLGNAEEVSVTIERNGQPQTLILNTSQLELDEGS